jgi:hypothetical protein
MDLKGKTTKIEMKLGKSTKSTGNRDLFEKKYETGLFSNSNVVQGIDQVPNGRT